MDSKPLLYGLIGFFLGGLIVSVAATTFDKPTENNSPTTSSMMNHSSDETTKLSAAKGDAYDTLFITQMSEHHAGAVAMAAYVANSSNPEIATLAQSITVDQTKELNDMKSWSAKWGYVYVEPAQSAIDTSTANLKNKSAAELDKQFITDMIGHHMDALDMARLSSSRAKHVEIQTLSKNIIASQTNEIMQMRAIAQSSGNGMDMSAGHGSSR